MKNYDLSFLQSELLRVSGLIEFADKKAAFLSVYYSAMMGFIFTKRIEILTGYDKYAGFESLYVLVWSSLLTSLLIGLYYLFWSIFPQLNNHNTDNSIFYFGHVAKYKFNSFINALNELDEDGIKHQLAEQIYTNSIIADRKMQSVKKSTQTLFIVITLFSTLIFLI
ncbi:MAG: hypothetical protein HYT94_00950 [Parcubacteria group bacterium]|nr:hypothetical protein [Parcubacteria group bacterium]